MYYIYGKHTKNWGTDKQNEPEKRMAPLDEKGFRVSLKDAYGYETKEEAQNIIDNMGATSMATFEIRKK